MKIMQKCLKSLFSVMVLSTALFAGHPTGKLIMVEITRIERFSSTEPVGNEMLNLTEFINDGFNGVMLRRYSFAGTDSPKEFFQEIKEAGLWLSSSPIDNEGYDWAVQSAKDEISWGADFLEIDEPFELAGGRCEGRHWLDTEADYMKMKNALPSDIPLIITDVYCNDKVWNWNIDGLNQEVYGTWMYPDYLNKVISWRNQSGKPAYVYINAYNRQLYNKCEVQTEAMNKQWLQGAWNNNVKVILFNFTTRCADCMTWGDCAVEPYNMAYGNDWPAWQRVVRETTAGTRVKFHEWGEFTNSDSTSMTPELTVKVRSEEAGLQPSSVECYTTDDYQGRWEVTIDNAIKTVWKKVPCSCTGTEGTKEWQTITIPKANLGVGGQNRVRFKIRDMCSSSYYRGPRWSRQEYTLPGPKNLAEGQPVKASSSHSVYVSANAVDGVASTMWVSGENEKNPYLQVDLGRLRLVRTIKLLPIPRSFEIWASDTEDFSDYTVLGSQGGTTFPHGKSWELDVKDSCRYLRLQTNSDRGQIGLYEFMVFDKARSDLDNINIAKGKSSSSSSIQAEAYPSANINDGNFNSIWASGTTDSVIYCQIDLEKEYKLRQIVVTPWSSNAALPATRTNFEILAANNEDMSGHKVLGSKTGDPFAQDESWTLEVTDTASYRYVRIQRINGAGYFTVAELQVYEAPKVVGTRNTRKLVEGPFTLRQTGDNMLVSGLSAFIFIDVYNAAGKLVLSSGKPEFNISGLARGTYYVNLRGKGYMPELFVKVK
ncbi:MAG: discoidin domain-containing protein [Fibrobacteria bacterium]|nr:discoidin domain-containing protein [Fibrobacteria bacterium]